MNSLSQSQIMQMMIGFRSYLLITQMNLMRSKRIMRLQFCNIPASTKSTSRPNRG